jgi:hypothetical protein
LDATVEMVHDCAPPVHVWRIRSDGVVETNLGTATSDEPS